MPSAHARTSRSERENVDEDILAMGKGAYKVLVMCEALLLPSSCDDVCRWRLILCSPSISTRSRFDVSSLFFPSLPVTLCRPLLWNCPGCTQYPP